MGINPESPLKYPSLQLVPLPQTHPLTWTVFSIIAGVKDISLDHCSRMKGHQNIQLFLFLEEAGKPGNEDNCPRGKRHFLDSNVDNDKNVQGKKSTVSKS